MKNKKELFNLTILFLLVSTLGLTSAANIGVSPANVEFNNVLRAGYAERPITITADSDSPMDVWLTPWGDIKDWITVSEFTTEVTKGEPKRVMVSVRPPRDIPNGEYTGFIRLNSSRLGEHIEGGTTSFVNPVLDLSVVVRITDIEIKECSATNFQISSAEEGDDIIFTAEVVNEGNIRFWPEFAFDIWDQDSINLVRQEVYSGTEVTPTQSEKLVVKIPSRGLDLGQYWVDVSATDCYFEQTLTFDILEEGALQASGILEKIIVEPWVDEGDIVSILASFRNNGEKPLEASFSGKITKDGKVVQLLESDGTIFVDLDTVEPFSFFFTPKDPGKYLISGRVFYDGKRTYEQTAVLNVRPKGSFFWNLLKSIAYIILIIIIAVLIYMIRKERVAYMARLRRIRG